MTTKTDERIARLEEALNRLEALGLTTPAPNPTTVNPDGTPGLVAPGELIESAWGNAVANSIARFQTRSYEEQGGRLIGTTNGAGDLHITYPRAFGSIPVVTAVNADAVNGSIWAVQGIWAVTATDFWVRCLLMTTGAPVATGSVSVAWIAHAPW